MILQKSFFLWKHLAYVKLTTEYYSKSFVCFLCRYATIIQIIGTVMVTLFADASMRPLTTEYKHILLMY